MFVDVAIPRSAPGALTYRVPETWHSLVQPGVRVRAPLRQRQVTGLVLAVVDAPPVDAALIRDLSEVLDPEPVLPAGLLELAEFVAGYYRCSIGDTLAAMLPAGLLRQDAEVVELTQAGAAIDPEALPAGPATALRRVREAGRLNVAALLARSGQSSRAAVEKLAAEGLVTVRRLRRDRPPQTEVGAVQLVPGELDAQLETCGRARLQRAVVEWLAEQGRPALAAEVYAATGSNSATLRTLDDKGLVQRFTQKPPRRARWSLGGPDVRHPLTDEQAATVAAVAEAAAASRYAPLLLEGVTGSGKTEVYLRSLEAVLEHGRTGLVLVPEIGLTPAASGAVERRFGDRVAVLHSAQSEGDRWLEWQRARDGEARIVVGPRSALFAPLPNLGLIVVDEEHDAAYKQQEAPRYHARDLALVLGHRLGVPVLMCSATPSVEAEALVARGLAERLQLTRRVAGGSLPEVELVDLRGEKPEPGEQGRTLYSRRLRETLAETLERGEQAILLIQRRGWAPLVQCRDCGHRMECPDCSVSLVAHQRSNDLRCHYCGYHVRAPERCPSCQGDLLDPIGAGTEKVADHFGRLFPGVPAGILDRDTVRRRGGLEATLGDFAGGRTRVLIGTQMVAKGHHFPNVTLTGVISADALLGLPDFRSAERTFQLLTQVGGRAGRGERPGRVVIQTYHPDNPAVRHAMRHDTRAFLSDEMVFRQAFGYPPTTRMVLVRYEAASEVAARRAAEAAAKALGTVAPPARVRGPAPAPIERLRGAWRWQLLLTAPNRELLRELIARVESVAVPAAVRRTVDVDPLSTL